MSDRYDDDRSWQAPAQETQVEDSDAGLDEARENVLEDWPSSFLASEEDVARPTGPHEAEPFSAEDAASGEPEPARDPVPEVEPFGAPEAASAQAAIETPDAVEHPSVVTPSDAPDPEHSYRVAPADAPEAVEHSSGEHAPGDFAVPPGYAVLEGVPEGRRRTVGVVVSRYNAHVTSRLLQSALDELELAGVTQDAITVMPVPGAFELPLAAMALAKTRRFAAVIALGCVIRGDTPHFDYVASEAASGLQLAALETGVPVAFGLLTLDREEQAEHRIVKGAEAVRTALEMADLFANLRTAAAS